MDRVQSDRGGGIGLWFGALLGLIALVAAIIVFVASSATSPGPTAQLDVPTPHMPQPMLPDPPKLPSRT